MNIVIRPLDHESNAVTLQAKEGTSEEKKLFYRIFRMYEFISRHLESFLAEITT